MWFKFQEQAALQIISALLFKMTRKKSRHSLVAFIYLEMNILKEKKKT